MKVGDVKVKNGIKGYILGILSTLIIIGGSVYASGLISGLNVDYDNTDSGLNSTTVSEAISELYTISETHCPTGYKCKYVGACEYAKGTSWDFAYTGSISEFEVPCTGLYKLEVWGGRPQSFSKYGFQTRYGGAGGYSVGYIELDKETDLYVVCGGGNGSTYNGGGSPSHEDVRPGAGATHIALVTGLLKDIGYSEFVTNKKGLIVAGGGGSGSMYGSGSGEGGSGGGLSGGNANHYGSYDGGTQSSGYAFGQGGPGGGGGLFGGNGGTVGAGGSGYIGGVPEITYDGVTYSPQSTAGVNSGPGKAKITLVEY